MGFRSSEDIIEEVYDVKHCHCFMIPCDHSCRVRTLDWRTTCYPATLIRLCGVTFANRDRKYYRPTSCHIYNLTLMVANSLDVDTMVVFSVHVNGLVLPRCLDTYMGAVNTPNHREKASHSMEGRLGSCRFVSRGIPDVSGH